MQISITTTKKLIVFLQGEINKLSTKKNIPSNGFLFISTSFNNSILKKIIQFYFRFIKKKTKLKINKKMSFDI